MFFLVPATIKRRARSAGKRCRVDPPEALPIGIDLWSCSEPLGLQVGTKPAVRGANPGIARSITLSEREASAYAVGAQGVRCGNRSDGIAISPCLVFQFAGAICHCRAVYDSDDTIDGDARSDCRPVEGLHKRLGQSQPRGIFPASRNPVMMLQGILAMSVMCSPEQVAQSRAEGCGRSRPCGTERGARPRARCRLRRADRQARS